MTVWTTATMVSWLARRRRRRELLRDAEELEQQAARLRRSTLTSMLDATGRHAPYAAAGLLALALFKPESRPVLESWGTPTNAELAVELESKAQKLREEAEHA